MGSPLKKLKLEGFNNLTKTLSFNIYDICYARTLQHRREYIEYIDEAYNSDRLTGILEEISQIIGATILNTARQDYYPQGASATMLIAEASCGFNVAETLPGPVTCQDSLVTHLDKSHITVHTYPESHPDNGIATFRADIDVATCGQISPLRALNFLLRSFDSDIVIIDYRVRGFTRDVKGRKHFIDHKISSVRDFIDPAIEKRYESIDINLTHENTYLSKMILKKLELNNYLFGAGEEDLNGKERKQILRQLRREMEEIFFGRNSSCT
uniref:S-adenosylmethionine decarboxylase proenzyme n=1 Tax=Candidatus Kentrum sp. TUN TaxID=2126343 RepID=A0A450ZHA1_9GAMM|nr:MAG: S-adenosylmethionine decarboxylase [Candidatus Kentron sp. TUN]VFK54015.1 MAG: S-adenosylmethionine decarboxylase [Candidatus Kentron sp. TUN]VFK58936.1 MAG: S-adenosylmethionine decarboxylase [Candidatus Kentron sp. TUN]